MKKHITPVDVFFYVLEGQVTIEIGDEQVVAGPDTLIEDTLIESPAKIPHRLANEGNGTGRILVVKTPRPSEATKIF